MDEISQRITVLAVPLASEIDEFKHTGVARRIHAWTWQSFPIGMGTAAVFSCLSNVHNSPVWIRDVARVMYYLTIAIFLFNVVTLVFQLILYPKRFRKLIFDPVMGIFVPMFCLSLGTIVIGTVGFAVPDGTVSAEFAYRIFWVYVGVASIVTVSMSLIWFDERHTLSEFTPSDAFLVYPLMLVGLIGGNVLSVMDPADTRSLGILFASLFFQGLGFFMAFFFLALYIVRIFLDGLLSGVAANAAFVACGPPGFTGAALILLSGHARTILPAHNLISPIAGEVWYAISMVDALLLFGLAVFFFVFSAIPYWFKLNKDLHQILGCWALTFPNVGWITTLKLLGDDLRIPWFYILHDIMTIAMCITWSVLVVCTSIAFWRKEIFYEQDVLPSADMAGKASALKASRAEQATLNEKQNASRKNSRATASLPLSRRQTREREREEDLEGGRISSQPSDISESDEIDRERAPTSNVNVGHGRDATGLSKRTLVGTMEDQV